VGADVFCGCCFAHVGEMKIEDCVLRVVALGREWVEVVEMVI
jgi:hypothetical protein